MNMLQISILTLRKAPAMLVLALAFFLSSCGEADTANMRKGEAPQSGEARLVYSVESIEVVAGNTRGEIQITARGHTRTGGWRGAVLAIDQEASSEARITLRFLAMRPTGMATQAITPIAATTTLVPQIRRTVRASNNLLVAGEVRVIAETNNEGEFFAIEFAD